ncbi:MAG TPA: exo-alpha-sialidase [Terriglobia bacterium]|nr:exo-alpha-sialidase [Terriglobia bacterium]
MTKWMLLGLMVTFLAAIPAPPTVVEIKSPAGAGSEEPNITAAPDGRIFMTWLEPMKPKGNVLRFSVREKQGWSAPRTIAQGTNWFVSGADFPSLAILSDGTLAAYWFSTLSLEAEAYNTNLVLSHDGGATWSKPILPHRDRKVRQHGFLSMVPTPDGRLAAIWLDGRKLSDEGEGDMSLIYTTIGANGALGTETTLDGRTCECCQTALTATPDGLLAVYRDRSDKEVRDISIVRYANGRWSQPEPLSKDEWEIDGCPVNGPAISASGRSAAVAWFTAPNEKGAVNVVISSDSGKTFGKAVKVDDGNPLGRVDVVSLSSGGALVSWVERTSQGVQLRARQIEASGVAGPSITVSGTAGVRTGGFPRMKRSGTEVVIAWTAAGDTPSVRTALLNLN